MKFGQKIFLISFTILIFFINVVGIVMINYTYKTNIEKEIEKNIIQINDILNKSAGDFSSFSSSANIYLKNNVNIEIYLKGEKVFTNFTEEDIKHEINVFDGKEKEQLATLNFENLEVTSKDYYKLSGGKINTYIDYNRVYMKLIKFNTAVITVSDITQINEMKEAQTRYFIGISLIISFTIAFILSIAVSVLTRKIKVINKAIGKVEKGDYSIRVKNLGNDEIGNFGKNFNNMTNAIEENINKIQEVSENRKRFIGNLTHEIRTPLTSIIGYSSLIKNKKVIDRDVIVDYSNRIYEEGKYIQNMNEKLMSMFLTENGSIELEKINLSNELKNILEELKIDFKEVEFEEKIDENVYEVVDKILIKSIIYNLVKNAIKAYESNPYIRIELNKEGIIKVIDKGKGIPTKELERIKEPFYTLSKDRNRKSSGLGLGIPLCIKMVEVQNGTLEINSVEGKGTEIIIKLGVKIEK